MRLTILGFARWLCQFPLPGKYIWTNILVALLGMQKAVVPGKVNGYNIDFDLSDILQRQIWFDLFDVNEIQMISSLISEGSIILDIGANIGYYSLCLSPIVGKTGVIHAFEPVEQNFQKIKVAIDRNNISNIVVNKVAVGSEAGTLTLFVAGDVENSGSASVVIGSTTRNQPIQVEMITGDDYLLTQDVEQVDFIKIDIEGFELEALTGLSKLLSRDDAPIIFYENNASILEKREIPLTAVADFLASCGYQYWYEINNRRLIASDPQAARHELVNYFASKVELNPSIHA